MITAPPAWLRAAPLRRVTCSHPFRVADPLAGMGHLGLADDQHLDALGPGTGRGRGGHPGDAFARRVRWPAEIVLTRVGRALRDARRRLCRGPGPVASASASPHGSAFSRRPSSGSRHVDELASGRPCTLWPRPTPEVSPVLDHDLPLVYCLPGRSGTVVVTRGAVDALSSHQLDLVLAHERSTCGPAITCALPSRRRSQPDVLRAGASSASRRTDRGTGRDAGRRRDSPGRRPPKSSLARSSLSRRDSRRRTRGKRFTSGGRLRSRGPLGPPHEGVRAGPTN